MSTVTDRPPMNGTVAGPAYGPTGTEVSEKGSGWIVFAATIFAVAATLNVIWGIAALANSGFFVAGAHYILLTNLHTWGWIAIGFGAVEFLAALSIWRGGAFGRWFGIFVAALATVAALMMMPAYPFWSLVLVAINILVMYGLAAYGGTPAVTD